LRWAAALDFPVDTIWFPTGSFRVTRRFERRVPALPFSRELDRLSALRHGLAIYRMVFGQSRQEDLITFCCHKYPTAKGAAVIAGLQIDLRPAKEPSFSEQTSASSNMTQNKC
jgi:hypothetical protein